MMRRSATSVLSIVPHSLLALCQRHNASGPRKNSFRPFSVEDEAQLVSVLTTKPRHVARHIRQSMQNSKKRMTQFRNSVTYLMIQLQGKLQRQEISPDDASAIVESVMKECVDVRQADMAHLLFRASLRFRKYGLRITAPCVKALFESYRAGSARELMSSLAEELKSDKDLVPLVVAAYVFGGNPAAAEQLLLTIPPSERRTEDLCAMIDGLGSTLNFAKLQTLLDDHLKLAIANELPLVNFAEVMSVAICCLRGDKDRMMESFKVALQHRSLCLPLSDNAVGAILKRQMQDEKTTQGVLEAEERLKAQLGVESLGLAAETVVISRCSEFIARGQAMGDEIMLTKVQHLKAVVESNLTSSGDAAEIDQQYIFSLIKGFGILGKLDDMRQSFDLLREHGAIVDGRVYDEVLRWYAYSNNVKEVIALKEEMTLNNVFHSSSTYHAVFRVLDKHYPRMIEKYYEEMKQKGVALEPPLYPVLVRVFGDLRDMKQVHELYADAKDRAQKGNMNCMSAQLTANLLRVFAANEPDRCEQVIHDASNYGHLTNDRVQAELLAWYANSGRVEEMIRLVKNLPYKSPAVYRVLVRDAAKRKDRPKFDELLREIRATNVNITQPLFSALLTAMSLFKDAEGVKQLVIEAKTSEVVHHANFFADAACAFARLQDHAAVDATWNELLESNLSISMTVYNRFLDLYMANSQLDKVQQILDTMMKTVPPNPITATTVVDMLGKMGRLTEMETLLEEMARSKNAVPTLVTFHQAMNAYAKAGDIHKLELIRQRIHEQGLTENHVTFNILAEGYGRAKRFEHLRELNLERKAKKIKMEEFGYVILLNIFARAKLTEEIAKLVEEIGMDDEIVAVMKVSTRLACSIATAYSFVGDTTNVEKYVNVVLQHPHKNPRDMESIALMYSRLRDVRRLQMLLDTVDLGNRTEMMYNVCVGAFAKAGEYTKVAVLLQEMEGHGMVLSRNTAVTLSSLLLKAGKVQLAQAVLHMKGGVAGATSAAARAVAQQPASEISKEKFDEMDEEVLLLKRHEEDLHAQVKGEAATVGGAATDLEQLPLGRDPDTPLS